MYAEKEGKSLLYMKKLWMSGVHKNLMMCDVPLKVVDQWF